MAHVELNKRCPATCWKGDPDDKMASKARCKWVLGHQGTEHLDENGNRFFGTGKDSVILAYLKYRLEHDIKV
jgi:hypothetical protein